MPPFTDHSSISVVVPIFDEERTLEELSRRLTSVLTQTALAYEILFVNDGSRDGSLDILRDLARDDARVKVLSLSRNFGHQMAITVGLDHAKGDAVVIMDGDRQAGCTSTVVIMLLLFAVQFDILGVYGEYIGRIYAEVKRRPLYIIEEQVNLEAPRDEALSEPDRGRVGHHSARDGAPTN